jgi:hypothetical protein
MILTYFEDEGNKRKLERKTEEGDVPLSEFLPVVGFDVLGIVDLQRKENKCQILRHI